MLMSKVAVTEAAVEHLQIILSGQEAENEIALRLTPQPGGRLVLTLDRPGEGDESIEAAGETVLVVAPEVADMLDGSVIDVQETEDGPKLTINR
jgi:Fe-S cluster assembly iron-binding protein IscA